MTREQGMKERPSKKRLPREAEPAPSPHRELRTESPRDADSAHVPRNVVYLVGAGPGDPGLLTLRARELLAKADVVVYDYLASDAVLRFADPNAEMHFVGKKGFSDHLTQAQVNDLLVRLARSDGPQRTDAWQQAKELHRTDGLDGAGASDGADSSDDASAADDTGASDAAHGPRRIVRLKGGDPFVFGRGGEEALALAQADIPFEVVPGVTAGVAAPAYAGIPVTHRGLASQVTLVTGHESAQKGGSAIDWQRLGRGTGTLCFYMGIHDLPTIAQQLMRHGRPADTPVALVRWGTMPTQQTLVSTLDHVAQDAKEAQFKAPAIIVVGEVVQFRSRLAWFERRPLFGKRVVVTRSRAQAQALSSRLADLGADVMEFPTIQIRPRALDERARADIAWLAGKKVNPRAADSRPASRASAVVACDWVVFTSANGVDCFWNLLQQAGYDVRALGGTKIAAIGPATAAALSRCGINADLVPKQFVAESVADALLTAGVTRGTGVLIPRASVARSVLPDALSAAGADVHVLPVYDTVCPKNPRLVEDLLGQLRAGDVDAVTFTSPSTVRNFWSLLTSRASEAEVRGLMSGVTCASIGPVTSEALRQLGLPVSVEASQYTIAGLADALANKLA
ncbi:MAG: uroporphyrinogen-III C-methyltransferase [Atopobiaceae bacterium]